MGPVGELQGLIETAVASGVTIEDLARALAPKVVLRDQLEHVGWLAATGDLVSEQPDQTARAVFLIPPQVVVADELYMEIPFGIGS